MWQHVVWEPDDDPDSETIEFERLTFGDRDIDVYAMPEGGFFVEAVDDCRGELAIGTADTMDEAKGLARQWMMGEISKLLVMAGAEGVWMLRGAYEASLAYVAAEDDADPLQVDLSPPHELIVLARFPAGDGRAPGIEFIG